MSRHTALKTATRPLLAATLLVSLAGCGFQLRGASPIPSSLQPLSVECSKQVSDSLCRSVRDQLQLSGLTLTPPADADYRLQLSDFRQDRRATAVSSDGSAAQYTLRLSVSLELITADGVPLIADTRLSASDSYSYDDTQVLAGEKEENSLGSLLADQLAQQVSFRLAPMTEARVQAIRDEYEASGAGKDTGTP